MTKFYPPNPILILFPIPVPLYASHSHFESPKKKTNHCKSNQEGRKRIGNYNHPFMLTSNYLYVIIS